MFTENLSLASHSELLPSMLGTTKRMTAVESGAAERDVIGSVWSIAANPDWIAEWRLAAQAVIRCPDD